MENNYYDIAMNELEYLQDACKLGHNYNVMIVQAQQVTEKLLKSLVDELCTGTDKLLKTHNLRALYDSLYNEGCILDVDRAGLIILKDFYFDARYPGDNFVTVTKKDFEEALNVMNDVVREVNSVRTQLGKKVIEPKSTPTNRVSQTDKMKQIIKEIR